MFPNNLKKVKLSYAAVEGRVGWRGGERGERGGEGGGRGGGVSPVRIQNSPAKVYTCFSHEPLIFNQNCSNCICCRLSTARTDKTLLFDKILKIQSHENKTFLKLNQIVYSIVFLCICLKIK